MSVEDNKQSDIQLPLYGLEYNPYIKEYQYKLAGELAARDSVFLPRHVARRSGTYNGWSFNNPANMGRDLPRPDLSAPAASQDFLDRDYFISGTPDIPDPLDYGPSTIAKPALRKLVLKDPPEMGWKWEDEEDD